MDVLAAVSEVESFEQRALCVVKDNVGVREGNPRESVPTGIFDHLCSKLVTTLPMQKVGYDLCRV